MYCLWSFRHNKQLISKVVYDSSSAHFLTKTKQIALVAMEEGFYLSHTKYYGDELRRASSLMEINAFISTVLYILIFKYAAGVSEK